MRNQSFSFSSFSTNILSFGRNLFNFVLPNQCGVCGAYDSSALLCVTCLQHHVKQVPRCICCGKTLPDNFNPQCGACLNNPPPFRNTWVAVDYTAPWDNAISALKFGHRLPYARLLAQVWLYQFAHTSFPQIDILLPVPLASQRLRERGFNQTLEIARPIAKQKAWALETDLLIKIRDTLPQIELSRRTRLHNVRNTFSCSTKLQGKHIAVIDDVMTSGATLTEIALTLKHAGAESVTNIVIARTPFD